MSLTPELNKINVLSNGMAKGDIGIIPIGGQILPDSILGTKLKWKNPQKKLKKKAISDLINHPIPHFNPSSTSSVCEPEKFLSRTISRIHTFKTKHPNKRLKKKLNVPNQKKSTKENKRKKFLIPIYSGQGLSSTIWNGWFSNIIILIWSLFIIFQEPQE